MSAIDDIAAERRRQIEAEGYKPEHDDGYVRGELAAAAVCYADPDPYRCPISKGQVERFNPPRRWPWSNPWWKPTTRRRDLVIAGALLVAEIERIDRAAGQSAGEPRP